MAKRKTKKKTTKGGASEATVAVGGLALIGSILKNLSQHEENTGLHQTVMALQQIVRDWQVAYSQLNSQLALALQANALQQQQLEQLREQVRDAQERAYTAEARALGAEAQVAQLTAQLEATGDADDD